MIIPSCEEILNISPRYDIIPLCREVYADVVTPITLLRRLAGRSKRFYLLESIEGGEKWGRYSFLGYDPVMRVTCRKGTVKLESQVEGIPSQQIDTCNPLQVLREILGLYKSPRLKGQPPFTGGFVGYFAYAMIGYAEPELKISRGEANDYDLMLFDKVIAYDHLKQKIAIVVNMKTGSFGRAGASEPELVKTAGPNGREQIPGAGRPEETGDLEYLMKEYGRACADIETIASLIHETSPLEKQVSAERPVFTCNVSKEEYCTMVERAKAYILEGDIFQAVISRRFTSSYEGSLLNATGC